MRFGVVFSSAAHVAILTWGLVSFSAPEPLQVADVEALPVDIVPIEEFTQSVEGDKQAELTETPAPSPTQRPETEPEAQNIGDAQTDLKSQPDAPAEEQPVEVAKVETPPPSETPERRPEIVPETKPAEENSPAATTEVAAKNEPAVPVTEESVEEPDQSETGEQFAALDQVKALPAKRPKPPKPQTAETSQRKKKPDPATTASASSDTKSENTTDDIASLLNKQEPSSSGAKKSTKTASLGTKKPSKSGKLSTSEMDALKAQLATCWSIPAGASGADELKASVEFELDQNAEIVGRPRITKSSGNRAFDSSAVRAIQRCERKGFQLPRGKHNVWNQVVVNFDPVDMF